MKKFGLFIIGLCTVLFVGNFTHANENYEFSNLHITANILVDGTVEVKEDYTANFFVERHGINRDIPLSYSVGGKDFHIEISDINVIGKRFTTSKSDGKQKIKIGDADRTVIGEQKYPISYSVYGLIRNFSEKGYAELYWDLVGDQWNTNINNFNAEIILPKPYTGFNNEDFLIKIGSVKQSLDEFDGIIDWSSGDKIVIKYDGTLPAYTKFSLSVKLPNNYFEFDHDRQSGLIGPYKDSFEGMDYIFIVFIIMIPFVLYSVVAALIIGIFLLIKFLIKKLAKKGNISSNNSSGKNTTLSITNWWRKSKIYMWINLKKGNLKGKYAKQFPVIIQYNPPEGLNSAEVGLLLHRGAEARDLFSLVYRWAYEKIIEIKSNSDGSIIIKKLKELPDFYPNYEKKFFNNLIPHPEKTILKNDNLYKTLNLNDLEYYGGTEKGRLTTKDDKYQKKFEKFTGKIVGLGVIVCTISFFLGFFGLKFSVFVCFISFFLTLIIGFFLGIINTVRTYRNKTKKETEKGAKLISHILGYRKFLAACDENKLRLFLKQDPLYFDKILPYAVVFGLDTMLIDRISPIMKDMNIKSDFYHGDFNYFRDISDTMSSISFGDTSSHSSYSSGGGFDSGSSFDSDFGSNSGGGGGGGSDW